jgi:hypothetical protein
MIAAATNNNHVDLPQTPKSLAKSHDDGDVKYFFQRPEQDINQMRQAISSKWSGDDSSLDILQVNPKFKILISNLIKRKLIN